MIDEDHCVYIKRNKDKYLLLSLYMDDILIARNDMEYLKIVVIYFWDERYGIAFYILRVKIHSDHSHKQVTLLQELYIKNFLK